MYAFESICMYIQIFLYFQKIPFYFYSSGSPIISQLEYLSLSFILTNYSFFHIFVSLVVFLLFFNSSHYHFIWTYKLSVNLLVFTTKIIFFSISFYNVSQSQFHLSFLPTLFEFAIQVFFFFFWFQILVSGNLSLKCCYSFLRLQHFHQLNSVDSHFQSSFYKCLYTRWLPFWGQGWRCGVKHRISNSEMPLFFREERMIHLLNAFLGRGYFMCLRFWFTSSSSV